jgi:hypothetical protein
VQYILASKVGSFSQESPPTNLGRRLSVNALGALVKSPHPASVSDAKPMETMQRRHRVPAARSL